MNNSNGYFVRVIALTLLVAIVQIHVCTAFCGIQSQWLNPVQNSDMACCSKTQESKPLHSDCQNDHIAFFQAVGQFYSNNTIEVSKIFQPTIVLDVNQVSIVQTGNRQSDVAFTGFHPPPPKDGIPVQISSFLI